MERQACATRDSNSSSLQKALFCEWGARARSTHGRACATNVLQLHIRPVGNYLRVQKTFIQVFAAKTFPRVRARVQEKRAAQGERARVRRESARARARRERARAQGERARARILFCIIMRLKTTKVKFWGFF